MLHQLFRRQVPIQILIDLLDKICLKTDKYYLIDANSFKVLLYNNYHENFCKTMLEYYHSSKSYYVSREFTYKSFISIIRQICKSNNIMYRSEMKYERSQYNIDYFVYFD